MGTPVRLRSCKSLPLSLPLPLPLSLLLVTCPTARISKRHRRHRRHRHRHHHTHAARCACPQYSLALASTGIVHGGFTAALFDDLFGWATGLQRSVDELGGTSFTVNLNTNYRRPCMANASYVVDIEVTRVVRSKKVYLSGTLRDKDGALIADSTSLYIVVQNDGAK